MLRPGCCPPCSGSIKSAWSLSKSSSNAKQLRNWSIFSRYFDEFTLNRKLDEKLFFYEGGGLERNWGFDHFEHLKLDVFDHM